MGRQSARLWFDGHDHKDIYFDGHYHKQMYLSDENANLTLLWEKLASSAPFIIKILDTMINYKTEEAVEEANGTVYLDMEGDFTVDWGDGTIDKLTEHVYPTSNMTEYTVTISGSITKFMGCFLLENVKIICSCITEVLSPLQESMNAGRTLEENNGVPFLAGMFRECIALKKVTSALLSNFKGYEKIEAQAMFVDTGFRETPVGIFMDLKGVNVSAIFANCRYLTTVVAGTFSGGTFQAHSSDIFSDCTALETVYDYPSGLYRASFEGCTNLETVKLAFINILNFERVFYRLAKLKNISSNLFSSSPNATTMKYAFSECTSLKEIPEGLFDNLYDVTSYYGCFLNCSALETVPMDLFDDSTKVTDFSFTFASCSNITSTVPELWLRDNVEVHEYCYLGCKNAANYDEIYGGWK